SLRGPKACQLYVQLSELHSARRTGRAAGRRSRRAVPVRPHLRGVVGQGDPVGRQGGRGPFAGALLASHRGQRMIEPRGHSSTRTTARRCRRAERQTTPVPSSRKKEPFRRRWKNNSRNAPPTAAIKPSGLSGETREPAQT